MSILVGVPKQASGCSTTLSFVASPTINRWREPIINSGSDNKKMERIENLSVRDPEWDEDEEAEDTAESEPLFSKVRRGLGYEDPAPAEPAPLEPEPFDREAFRELAAEFGGMARSYITREEGEWTQEKMDKALLRIYRNRNKFVGLHDQEKRGLQAWIALSDPESAMVDRVEHMYREQGSR